MGWEEKYRQASFRNVNFYVPSYGLTSGRRWAINNIPGRDVPDVKDLGRQTREITIEAYVIGPDYFNDRDLLLDALEKEGDGKLVHPYLGTLWVCCVRFEVKEQQEELRIARFSITFVERGQKQFTVEPIENSEVVFQKAEIAVKAAQNNFVENYDLSTTPVSSMKNVETFLEEISSVIFKIRQSVYSSAEFQYEYNLLAGKINSIIYNVWALSAELIRYFTIGFDYTIDKLIKTQFDEMKKIWRFIDEKLNRKIENNKHNRIIAEYLQTLSVIKAAELITMIPFSNWNEAKENYKTLSDKMIFLANNTKSDSMYEILIDLKGTIFKILERKEFNLPRLFAYTPSITVTSLWLSYYLYGSIKEENEIIQRNKIQHPGFILGQRKLEVKLNV